MAKLYLLRAEMAEYTSPKICMRCAAPATMTLNKAFYWTRGGYFSIGFLGLVVHAILLLTGTKRFRIPVPLCAKCYRRRIAYRLFVWSSVIALLLMAFVGAGLAVAGNGRDNRNSLGAGLLFFATVGAVILLVVGTIHQARSIRPAVINTRWMGLHGVSPVFVDAVSAQRENYSAELRLKLAEGIRRR
jgi:hypothetical protein